MIETIEDHGYKHQVTAANSSSQNGMIERPHRTLKEKMRCILYSSRLGTEFWVDAILHAIWLYNRTYHLAIMKTPFEAMEQMKPKVRRLDIKS